MDNSILYGLRNPAMTDDIGMSMIERQFPTNITPLGYTPSDVTNKSAYFNQPYNDTFEQNGSKALSKRDREKSLIKKILVGLGVAALAFFGLRKGVKGIKSGFEYVKNIFKSGKKSVTPPTAPKTSSVKNIFTKGKDFVVNVFSKCKNWIINIFNKIKTKISP
ncbi:hypothetical protein J6N69_00540 [bacterium]|nr:hypothetical protein [bacterium]